MARPRVKKPAGATRTRSFEYLTEPDSALVSCGKLFCTKCLQRYGRRRRCPSCGETRPFYFADTRGKAKLFIVGMESHWVQTDPDNFSQKIPIVYRGDLVTLGTK